MAKVTGLKPGAKYAILGIAIVAILATLKFTVLDKNGGTLNTPTTQTEQTTASNSDVIPASNTTTSTATGDNKFNYVAEEPVGGVARGVVEVGSTGFNAFVIEADANKNYKVTYKEFGKSLAKEGLATTEDIKTGLKNYIATIAEHGVNGRNIHFVVSSGAQQSPNTKVFTDELSKQGYVVNKVTPEQEAIYAFKATVPKQFQENSYVVDLGGGNTKISWIENGKIKTAGDMPGAKYHQDGKTDADVYAQVKALASKVPSDKRTVCFIIGGVPYALAKQAGITDRYVKLNGPDAYSATSKKETAGLNIYKAIKDGTNTDTFVFDNDANFTIGYLLSLSK
jgi:Ethanolamine utilization protein EutJ (predicted chaperonin)